MKKENIDSIYSAFLALIISGVVFELIYLKTGVFTFNFMKLFFIVCLYEAISIKRMFMKVRQDLLNYSTYLKLYLDIKFGEVKNEEITEYFKKLVEEARKK